jgi:hypothetical protein
VVRRMCMNNRYVATSVWAMCATLSCFRRPMNELYRQFSQGVHPVLRGAASCMELK